MPPRGLPRACVIALACCVLSAGRLATASLGDRLPEFRQCVQDCESANCREDGPSISLLHTLTLWDCAAECDYTCQHLVTARRLSRDPPYLDPVVQFHGKWPFHRFLGMQEPASVLFSLLNWLAHHWGVRAVRQEVPATYALRPYYLAFGYFGLASWACSMLFHTRDFAATEKLDYFAAAASVVYGMFYTPIRIFRWDRPDTWGAAKAAAVRRAWAALCAAAYLGHVAYLSFWSFDYTYNMAANVVVGLIQNVLWTWFSVARFRKVGRLWAAWPGLIVFWIIFAMSLELFDFPPWGGMVDAHALWHLGTVGPTIWWYRFLIRDAKEDMQSQRLKQ